MLGSRFTLQLNHSKYEVGTQERVAKDEEE